MSTEPKVPLTFGISAGAVARGRAAADPGLRAPANAKVTVSNDGKKYSRWTETGIVDQVWQETTKGSETKPKLAVFVVAVRMRPGEPNQNKLGFFRIMVHPDIAAGKPVSEKVREAYEVMTERNLGSLVSLLDVAGQMGENGEISPAKLALLFPAKGGKSKLTGTPVTVKISQAPNEGGTRDTQENADVFLPPKPLEADPETPAKSSPFTK